MDIHTRVTLPDDEITDHEGQCQHEHFHAIACKLGALLAIYIEDREMISVLGAESGVIAIIDVSATLPHSLKACFGDEMLAFRGEKIRATQTLCGPVQDSRNNVNAEQAQIPRHIYDICHSYT